VGGLFRLSRSSTAGTVQRSQAKPALAGKSESDVTHRVEDLPLEPLKPGRKLNASELTPALIRKADEVLFTEYPPVGTVVPIELEGRLYVGRVEVHYHKEGGTKRPWGRHRGITLYAAD
jgi:hypothetical protein